MASGPVAHLRFTEVVGLMPAAQAMLFGSEGTLRVDIAMSPKEGNPDCSLYGGRSGDSELTEIDVLPEKAGDWRVEEEFVNAIRGVEQVTHTTFEDGVRYMEFTEAVTRSAQTGMKVPLPL
jgi:predicted dehydrogenase